MSCNKVDVSQQQPRECIWHYNVGCRDYQCVLYRDRFQCITHKKSGCIQCTTLLQWQVRQMRQSQEEEVSWSKCTIHTSGDQCQFLSCRACMRCEPIHKHHEDPAENASMHVGASFLIRPYGREWVLATHPTSHCSPKLEYVMGLG